jgi:hypothetical protein
MAWQAWRASPSGMAGVCAVILTLGGCASVESVGSTRAATQVGTPPVAAAPVYMLVPIPATPQRVVYQEPPPAGTHPVATQEGSVLAPFTPTPSPLLRPGAVR